jgi:hypothetical protein
MDARSNEPGLDIPQTRQRLAPGLTSAPQLLQAKAKEVIPVRAVDPRQNTCVCRNPHPFYLADRIA